MKHAISLRSTDALVYHEGIKRSETHCGNRAEVMNPFSWYRKATLSVVYPQNRNFNSIVLRDMTMGALS
jgi:hypothetical protein